MEKLLRDLQVRITRAEHKAAELDRKATELRSAYATRLLADAGLHPWPRHLASNFIAAALEEMRVRLAERRLVTKYHALFWGQPV